MEGWQGLEIRHLDALVAVGRARSFRGAAAALGYAQSAVSQRVTQIERRMGTRLVERSRGRGEVKLTEAGKALVARAGEILTELDAALADLRALAREPRATLRLGANASASTRLLPAALGRLSDSAPDLSVALHEDRDPAAHFPLVADGTLDAALADLPLAPGPFAYEELVRDPYVLVVPADSPLADRPDVPTLDEIASMSLIVARSPILRPITAYLRATGVEPRIVDPYAFDGGVQSLVAGGEGVAVTSRLSVDECDARVVAIPLHGTLPARRVCLYWHRRRRNDEAIRQLLAAIRSETDRDCFFAATAEESIA